MTRALIILLTTATIGVAEPNEPAQVDAPYNKVFEPHRACMEAKELAKRGWLRRRHLAPLTVEQKAAVSDTTAADAVWPIVALVVVIHFPPRFAFAFLSASHQAEGAIAVLVASFGVLVALSVTQLVRLRRLDVPRDYRRSTVVGATAVYAALLLLVIVLVRYAISYDAAAATPNA